MRILTRYLLLELLKVLLLTLSGMTALIILAFVAKEAVDEGLGPMAVLRLVPYVLPQAMQFAVPGTVLLAATCVLGRMSAGNEFVAVKSLGISPMALVWPALALATLISFFTVWLNDVAVSWGRMGVKRVIIESLEQIAYGRLSTHGSFSASGISISVQDVQDDKLIEPEFTLRGSPGRPRIKATAQSARLESNPAQGTLTLLLERPEVIAGDGDQDDFRVWWPASLAVPISLSDFSRVGNGRTSPSNVALKQIPTEIRKEQEKIQQIIEQSAVRAGFELLTGDFENLKGEDWHARQVSLANSRRTLSRLRTEPHRRWANGFCCLAFVMVGVPVAILRRHGEFLASFFVVFLPILGAFYPLLFLGIEWAKDGRIPPSAVWTGNLVFAAWGVWLLRRVMRF